MIDKYNKDEEDKDKEDEDGENGKQRKANPPTRTIRTTAKAMTRTEIPKTRPTRT